MIFHVAVEGEDSFRFASINPAFSRVTGLSAEMVVGKNIAAVIPESSLGLVLQNYRKAIERKSIVRWEEMSDYAAGSLVGEVSVAPVFDEAGRCTHLVGSVHDITDRKRAEKELMESQRQLRSLAAQLRKAREEEGEAMNPSRFGPRVVKGRTPLQQQHAADYKTRPESVLTIHPADRGLPVWIQRS